MNQIQDFRHTEWLDKKLKEFEGKDDYSLLYTVNNSLIAINDDNISEQLGLTLTIAIRDIILYRAVHVLQIRKVLPDGFLLHLELNEQGEILSKLINEIEDKRKKQSDNIYKAAEQLSKGLDKNAK